MNLIKLFHDCDSRWLNRRVAVPGIPLGSDGYRRVVPSTQWPEDEDLAMLEVSEVKSVKNKFLKRVPISDCSDFQWG